VYDIEKKLKDMIKRMNCNEEEIRMKKKEE
jgi:hypothetical protein